jgi:hypothetical protein
MDPNEKIKGNLKKIYTKIKKKKKENWKRKKKERKKVEIKIQCLNLKHLRLKKEEVNDMFCLCTLDFSCITPH